MIGNFSFTSLFKSLPVRIKILCPLLAFLIPLAVRAVPELLMGPYLVGFDSIAYYVPFVYSWIRHGLNSWSFLAEVPLLYCILTLTNLLGVDLILAIKSIAPLLHGFLALTVYGFSSHALNWSPKKSLLATLLVTLYFVALRISWDLLRNELALIFLFIALTLIPRVYRGWKSSILLASTMILVALSHELVTAVLFIIVGTTVLRFLFKKELVEARSLVLSSLPAVSLFLLIFYAKCMVSSGEFLRVLLSFPAKGSEGWLSLYGFTSYPDMVLNLVGFLLYCHLLLLPLVKIGAKSLKNFSIKSWTIWSLTAVLLPVLTQSAWFGGYRWVLMMTYPLSFYAVEGITKVRRSRRLFAFFTIGICAAAFLAMPYPYGFFALRQYTVYIPSSMLQNSLPLNDCGDTVNVLQRLKSNMGGEACLLTHRAFYGWALQRLDESQIIQYEYENPETVAGDVAQLGYSPIYLIWWVNGLGWYGQPTVPSSFQEVYHSGRIAIYMVSSA